MRISESYYAGGINKRKLPKIYKSVSKNEPEKGIHVVILPVYGKNLLEIYDYGKLLEIMQKAEIPDVCVVGIAKDYDCALDLVTEIVQDVYNEKGKDFPMREYFE